MTVNQDLNMPDEHAVSASLHSQGRRCPSQTLRPSDGQCHGNEHKADVCFLKDSDTGCMKESLGSWHHGSFG